VRLAYLADHPEARETLARWHHAEWGHLLPEWSLAEALAELATHTARRAAPTTVIALADGRLAGSASLLLEDMPGTAAWSPWLASVFVEPAHRGRGIGAALVDRVVVDAGRLGFPALYLFTTEAEAWYAPRGWRVREHLVYAGRDAVIMGLDLNPEGATFQSGGRSGPCPDEEGS
jgi:N-acetylglutamate synthase-like GNAT family acetyltransferase